MLDFLRREREKISYLFFGALTTLVNFVAYALLDARGLPTGLGDRHRPRRCRSSSAYVTNRIWVFRSRTRGVAAWREFGSFVLCRLGTLLIDMAVMLLGVDVLGVRLFSGRRPPSGSGSRRWICGATASNSFPTWSSIVLNYVFSKAVDLPRQGRPGRQTCELMNKFKTSFYNLVSLPRVCYNRGACGAARAAILPCRNEFQEGTT